MGLFDSKRNKKKEVSKEDTPITDSKEVSEGDSGEDTPNIMNIEEIEQVVPTLREVPQEEEPPLENEVSYAQIKDYSEKKRVSHVVGQTKIIAILNQKGGVGKSTTAINLSAALGELNREVLLVDLDPQGNASSGLGIDQASVPCCVYDVLKMAVDVQEAIIPDVQKGLDVIPATINLAGAEIELSSEMARENRLKEALGKLRGRYDYIFIDCPPSLGLLTINALVAADSLLIPIQTEFYALEGVTKLLETMKLVKNLLNPSLDIFGVLLTMYDGRTTLSKDVAEQVRAYFKKKAFETMIPRTVKLSEAPSFGLPITQFDPSCKGALAYKDLAKEVVRRG